MTLQRNSDYHNIHSRFDPGMPEQTTKDIS